VQILKKKKVKIHLVVLDSLQWGSERQGAQVAESGRSQLF
jgi:hypothetical protein